MPEGWWWCHRGGIDVDGDGDGDIDDDDDDDYDDDDNDDDDDQLLNECAMQVGRASPWFDQ